MDFNLPPEAAEMQEATRAVVDGLLKFEPHYHETGEIAPEVETTLREMGYYGMSIPEEYGGNPLDHLTQCAIQLELGRLPPQFWPWIRNTLGPQTHTLIRHGTDEMKREWLPKIATGEKRLCIAITEPHCGSDAAKMSSTAEKDGDHYVLNGVKTYISNANIVEGMLVLAKTDKAAGKNGISAFIVPTDAEGFQVVRTMPTTGWMDNSLCEIAFTDCRVPASALVGELGRGLSYAMSGMNEGRLNVGCQALGAAQIAFDESVQHAKTRMTFGELLGSHQAIQHMLADMAMDLQAAKIFLYEAIWRASRGEDSRMRASMVKVLCTEAACRIADAALQIHGGSGYCRGMVVERVYRDVRVLRIYEGASEIHRNMIARQLLAD